MMDPDKRFTCAQLLQHSYFEGFGNEFDRERKEHNKASMASTQTSQTVKASSNGHVAGPGQTKQASQGVSLLRLVGRPHTD
jgi:hypothetical protein